eukprot:TRINITY_DN562_c0_g5_i2.p1 TRINITY_DN562_c0_g5~~TRINITY_DN562_c0_g5_i2.p1  ORF type:complete len:278 (-),score=58.28 TRINITY_DN562_c0_g5_i2:191-1024(-)
MSALVCGGKRSLFEDPNSTIAVVSKRLRCSPTHPSSSLSSSSSSSLLRLSPPLFSLSSSPIAATPLAHLKSLFPDMDDQLLERALEACGNDLDSTIKSLNDLRLGSVESNIGSAASKSDTITGANVQLSSQGIENSGGDAASEDTSAPENLPTDGSEWVELFVKEMMNASDMDDARSRASRVLQVLEKSIVVRTGAATENCHKENMILKEQVEVLTRDNAILKRAVAIQHEHKKEYDEKSQELQHLKQLVSQYQEQVRTLEAQQSNSIPGRFHPDVF